jgi:anaerobic magnesium-protoporphyrin IX monomethyl ester cyclase
MRRFAHTSDETYAGVHCRYWQEVVSDRARALVVDLNNFARYPTLAVGYLVASLTRGGYDVELLSPFATRLPTMPERRETWWDHAQRRVFFATHPAVLPFHDVLARRRRSWVTRADSKLMREASHAMDEFRPDVLLLSAYLDYGAAVRDLAKEARARHVPVILGGPAFNMPEVAERWLRIPGVTAIVAAEVDHTLPQLVDTLLGDGDLSTYPGVYLPDGRRGPVAHPLRNLDDLPVPDLSQFPWGLYPNKIIPVMTGRGCSWANCTFCSDVKVVNGLSFRSRPVAAVLDEIQQQSRRYGTADVIFLDIKLNSELEMWRGIIESFQECLPGGRWIGTVHVAGHGENGLTRAELSAAARAGLTRISFGLETGSQRLNNAMAKGTSLERTSQFLVDAHAAGISVRGTAILGYPGETAEDIEETVAFLTSHQRFLDRIRMNRFTPLPGTRFHELYERHPERFEGLTRLSWDFDLRRGSYRYEPAGDRRYRHAKKRLLRAVHEINRRSLRPTAAQFDGLM